MSKGIDLDALIGETTPYPLTYKGQTFDLPAELPGTALAPFLADDLGLIDIVTDVFEADQREDESMTELIVRVIKARPTLPKELLAAGKASLADLLGEHADEFFALKPSINAYYLIATHITGLYGFGVADFFESDASSETGGTNSKETSSVSTESTPEVSGDAPVTPVSSEPVVSES